PVSRSCVLTELRGFLAAQRARRAPRHPRTGQLDQGIGAVDAQLVVDELAQVGQDSLVIHEGSEVLVEAEQPAHRPVPLLGVARELRLQSVKMSVELPDLSS